MKLIKGFFSSSKDIYRLKYPNMMIGCQNKQNNKLEFYTKYDLTNYQITLSKNDKEKFYLVPINETLNIPKLKFIASSREDRARWF